MATVATAVCGQDDAPEISGLQGEYRNGQVFLTWSETGISEDARLSVYCSPKPTASAADVDAAHLLAPGIHPGSARDWWQDPASFKKDTPHAPPVGFVIRAGHPPLDPSG